MSDKPMVWISKINHPTLGELELKLTAQRPLVGDTSQAEKTMTHGFLRLIKKMEDVGGVNHLWDEEGYCVNCKKDAWDLSESEFHRPNCPGKPQKVHKIEQS